MRSALLLVLILTLAPLTLAQEHEHKDGMGMAVVLHDGPASGRAVVGAYTHFGFALMSPAGGPTPHRNAEFALTQNGEVLFSTTDTHEYDGLFSFDFRFTKPGPYQVMAMSGDMEMGFFEGEAILPVNATEATIDLVAEPTASPSSGVNVVLAIHDAAGALIEHSDAIVEFRNAADGALRVRTHLHIHDAPIALTQALGPETEYVAQVVGYMASNSGRLDDVPAVVAEFPITVGPVSAPAVPMPEVAPPALLEQLGASANADGLTLNATYDPNNQVGVGQIARLAGTLWDENNTPVPHVDFAFTLAGPRGVVFSSESGHEYDGVFEYLFVPPVPGLYDGTLTATYDETQLSVPVHLQVVPPVVAALGGAGPIAFEVEGLDAIVSGEAANLTFSAMGPSGPAAHSEVDVTIFHEGEPPLYQFKLHTHDSGLTNAIVVLPHEGDWQLRIDGLPTVPEPSVYAPALFDFVVAPGNAMSAVSAPLDGETPARVPGAWGALALVGVAIAVAFLPGRR